MKEYKVVKIVELTFIIEANSPEEAEELAWTTDDRTACDYAVYDIVGDAQDYPEDEEE